jgi:hypothetical protein
MPEWCVCGAFMADVFACAFLSVDRCDGRAPAHTLVSVSVGGSLHACERARTYTCACALMRVCVSAGVSVGAPAWKVSACAKQ